MTPGARVRVVPVAQRVWLRTTVVHRHVLYEVVIEGEVAWARAVPIRAPYARRALMAREQERIAAQHRDAQEGHHGR